jgi:hypothetical protein
MASYLEMIDRVAADERPRLSTWPRPVVDAGAFSAMPPSAETSSNVDARTAVGRV